MRLIHLSQSFARHLNFNPKLNTEFKFIQQIKVLFEGMGEAYHNESVKYFYINWFVKDLSIY